MNPVRYKTEGKWSVTPDWFAQRVDSPLLLVVCRARWREMVIQCHYHIWGHGLWCVFLLTSLLSVFPASSWWRPVPGLRATRGVRSAHVGAGGCGFSGPFLSPQTGASSWPGQLFQTQASDFPVFVTCEHCGNNPDSSSLSFWVPDSGAGNQNNFF